MDVEPELSGFLAKNPAALTKQVFICTNTFENFFHYFFWSFLVFEQRCLRVFSGIDFSRVVKNKFYVSRGTFDVESFFSNCCFQFQAFRFWSKIFGLLFEGLRARCRNCVLCIQREVLTKTFSELAFVSIVFRTLWEFFWLSEIIFPAGLSKLELISPGEHLKGSLFLWKSVIVFLFSNFKRNNLKMLSKL